MDDGFASFTYAHMAIREIKGPLRRGPASQWHGGQVEA